MSANGVNTVSLVTAIPVKDPRCCNEGRLLSLSSLH